MGYIYIYIYIYTYIYIYIIYLFLYIYIYIYIYIYMHINLRTPWRYALKTVPGEFDLWPPCGHCGPPWGPLVAQPTTLARGAMYGPDFLRAAIGLRCPALPRRSVAQQFPPAPPLSLLLPIVPYCFGSLAGIICVCYMRSLGYQKKLSSRSSHPTRKQCATLGSTNDEK